MRIAVIGHVEHVTLGRVPALPAAGGIAHLETPIWLPGGGGGVAFHQLAKSAAEVHLFTAIGQDEAGAEVAARLAAGAAPRRGMNIHSVQRPEAHTRDLVLITPDGERTIVVVGEPLHPRRADDLPWEILSTCDAAYFTAQDPAAIVAARSARLLVVTARRRPALIASGVRADVVVGSAHDPREASRLQDYPVRPGALVLTEGRDGGSIASEEGVVRFASVPAPSGGGAYGAGDSFAGALVYFLAAGLAVAEACRRAARYGAAVLAGLDPLAAQLPLTLEGDDPA